MLDPITPFSESSGTCIGGAASQAKAAKQERFPARRLSWWLAVELVVSSMLLFHPARVHGADYTWQVSGTNNNWSITGTDTNWFIDAGTSLSAWANANAAIFSGATGETITINGTVTPTSTTINDNGNWTFANGTSGVIGGTLTKNGTGTLTLGVLTNAFTGVTINGGIVSLGTGGTGANTSAVGALGTGAVNINTGGTLRLWIQNSTAFTITNNLVMDGGTLRNEDGNHTMSGTVLLNAGGGNFVTQWDGKNLTLSGVISGTGAARISTVNQSTSKVIMTATNTYTGGTTVNSGTLQLGTDATVDKGGSGYIRGAVTVNSGATLLLNASNAFGYTAGAKVDSVTLNGGTLTHAGTADNGWGLAYTLTGALMQATGGGRFSFGANSGGTGTSVTTLASATSSVISGNIRIRENNPGNSVVFTVADGVAGEDLVVHSNIDQNASGFGITKAGTGMMLMTGSSTFSGNTVVNGGTLALGNSASLASSTVVVNTGGTFRLDATGKTLAALTANDGSTVAIAARTGATTTLTGALTLTDGASISLAPIFTGAPAMAGNTYDLITAGSIAGTGTVNTNFNLYGQSRITGTTAVVGNVLRLTLTTGAGNLLWTNGAANGLWDVNTSANFDGGVFLSYDAVTFDDTVSTGSAKTVNLVGTVAPSLLTFNNSTGNDYTLNATAAGAGQLIGAGSLVKNGTGTVTLGGNLSYNLTGDITVNAGTLALGSKTLANVSSVLLNGGNLNSGTVYAQVYDLRSGSASAVLAGPSGITKTTTGTVTLSGANTYAGTTTVSAGSLILTGNNAGATGAYVVNGGTLQVGAGSTTGALGAGAVSVASVATLLFNRSDSGYTIANVISGAGAWNFTGTNNGVTNGTSGYLISGNNSGFTGTVSLTNARITVDSVNDVGAATMVTVGANSSLYLSTGTLTNAVTISGNGWGETAGNLGAIRLNGGATIAGPVTLAGNARITAYNGTGTVSGAIGDGGNNYGLTLGVTGGTSNITLSGVSTYTGATSIFSNASNQVTTVNLTGSLGNTAVTVSGFSTLTGEGTIGTVGGTGSLTFQAGSTLNADLTTAGALTVNGALTFSGATTINLFVGGVTNGTSYVVARHTGALTGLGNLTAANASSYRGVTFTDVANELLATFVTKALTWTGSTNGTWDINTTTNWIDGSSVAEKFYQADAVTFNDGPANTTITLAGALTPSTVTFNNSTATTYTINATTGNTISGSGSVLKTNTGTVVFTGANTFSGGTVIRSGSIWVQNAASLGTGSVTLGDASTGVSNTSLYIDSVAAQNMANTVVISANGSGTATVGSRSNITGAAFFSSIQLNRNVIFDSNASDRTDYRNITGTGNILVSGAQRSIFNTTNTFVGDVTVTTTNGAALQLGVISTADHIPDASNLTISANAIVNLSLGTDGIETINGLFGSGFVGTNSGTRNIFRVGAANGNGDFSGILRHTIGLTKTGTGTQKLTNTASSYTGVTSVNGGVLEVSALANGGVNSSIGASTNVATNLVFDGGVLSYVGGTDTSTDRLLTLGTNGGGIEANGTGALTFGNTGSAVISGTNTARTFSLSGTNTGLNIFALILADNGTGLTAFNKNGVGKWVISGNNTFTGVININGGTLQVGNGGTTGALAGSGTINMAAGTTLVYNRTTDVTLSRTFAGATTGTIVQDGTGNLTLSGARLPNSLIVNAGTVTLTGGGFSSNRLEGNGTVTVNSGGMLVIAASNAHALGGDNANMSESVTINGTGMLVLNSEQYFRTLTLNNGGSVSGTNEMRTSTSSTSLRVTGSSSTASVVSSNVQNYNAANWTVDDITASSNVDLQITGKITGSNALNKAGAGTMELTSNENTYVGGTNINAGTLLVNNNTGSASGTGQVTLAAGATLGGNGGIAATAAGANLTLNGYVRVGNVGDNLFTSDLNLRLGAAQGSVIFNGTLEFDIFAQEEAGVATDHFDFYGDVLRFDTTNAVVLGGQLRVVADPVESTSWDLGDSWMLIDWTNVNMANVMGSFTSYVLPDLAEGLKWDTSLIGSTGYISVIVVPEPGRAVLLLLGAVVMLARRRRKA